MYLERQQKTYMKTTQNMPLKSRKNDPHVRAEAKKYLSDSCLKVQEVCTYSLCIDHLVLQLRSVDYLWSMKPQNQIQNMVTMQ